MTTSDRRIPVTEERWRQLRNLEQSGETYDALLAELVRGRKRRHLAERTREVREADEEDLTSLDEL